MKATKLNKMLNVHLVFEEFIMQNKLDFSLVRNPKGRNTNNYVELETAQIFDVFCSGFYSACKQLTVKK